VIVFSIYHTDTARITQEVIAFRQSRVFDIASETFDSPDVCLLIHWFREKNPALSGPPALMLKSTAVI
jgi:hypothetical protein